MLLELQGSSEMKAGVSGGHEHVSPEPVRAFVPCHPIQFIAHAICVPLRNNLCCYKPELHGPLCCLCTHLRAILLNSSIFLPLSPAFFLKLFSEILKRRSLFSVFNAWFVAFALAVSCTDTYKRSLGHNSNTHYSTVMPTMRPQRSVISFWAILSCE